MSNGLLNGLTEAWNPDVTLAMIGQKTGLNTNTDSGLTYVAQAGFPGGHALLCTGPSAGITTPSSSLLQAIALTDFMLIAWMESVTLVGGTGVGVTIGENNTNGVDMGPVLLAAPRKIQVEIPGLDGQFNCQVLSNDNPYTEGSAHMLAGWYTTADQTLRISIDAGTPYSLVNTTGVGPSDPTNALSLGYGCTSGQVFIGPVYLWQGTAGVANAIARLSNLYTNKLRHADFDSGGGGVTASGNSLTSWV